MPGVTVDLRPDRRLLDHQFEGYKLNLQALPTFSNEVFPVDRLFPDDLQYSFVHAKLFALQNHLITDHFDHRYNFYYFDQKQQVRRITFDSISRSFESLVVYDVPAHVERKSGHFNLSLIFPSCNLAVISDGTGYLHIVATDGRQNQKVSNSWRTLHSLLALGENKFFVLVDAHLEERDDTTIIHCLLQSVEQSDGQFNSILSWVTLQSEKDSWKYIGMKQLQGKGIVHYAAIETNFSAVYVASDNEFKYITDTENDVSEPQTCEPPKKIYTWLQTTEDITITMKLPENFNKELLFVTVSPIHLKVSYAGNTFVDGKLRKKVDSELTTWNVDENGKVDILLTKSDSELWDELLEGGDAHGEQVLDASLVEEVHKRLAHLCSEVEVPADQSVPGFSTQELEECDAASEEDTVLVRLDSKTHQITHRVPLSVHQYLFSVRLGCHEVPALALRHDVDTCIWQPYAKLEGSESWPLKHEGTLMAFGYIQSSKQNRKFVACPSDFSYSVVCEASRHLFIYRTDGNKDSQLRHRTNDGVRNVKVGQQHVINIDKYGEVLGICATISYLFILTEKKILAVQIM